MREPFSLPEPGRPFRSLALAVLVLGGLGLGLSPARAQVVDLDTDLASLLTQLLGLPSSATTADRLANLDDVAARLLAPDGLLSDISAEIGNQGHLLDLRAADVAALRVDLSSLRSQLGGTPQNDTDITDLRTTVDTHTTTLMEHERRIDQNSTDITELRTTVGTHTTTLTEHGRRIDQNSTDIATLNERSTTQGRDIQRLDGKVANHETRITTLETMVSEERDLQDARIDNLGRQLNSRMDRMDDRIDTATEGVAMAMALKSPYVPDDKSFALSGGWGNFEGKNAFGMSGAIRAGRGLQIDAGLAVGADQGSVGGRAGATFTW